MSLAKRLMTILNVAEKNDAAKAIANFLSNGHVVRNEGKSKFNKLYEFSYNFNGSQTKMIMTSVSGHLMNYAFPFECKNWSGINPVELFDRPVAKVCIENMSPLKASLEQLIKGTDMLIIWTDCDREGENIGMEIVNVCRAVKSNIRVKRAKFSQITKISVTNAINNLVEIDLKASQAVDVRQELDLRIGASFTRLQTLHLRRMFPEVIPNQVVSYGSCQFPTLGFVVDRFKAIENFISEPFWKIVLKHKKDGNDVEFNWDRIRLFDEDLVKTLLDSIIDGGSLACVFEITSKPKSKWRPFPMDTIELEQLSSRKLNIDAKQTMQIAEKLYSQGYISYPRTETNIFPKDIDLKPLVEMQTVDGRWSDFASKLLTEGLDPRNGKKSDQAHPPIHPLKLGTDLKQNEARVYELITRHFLACLYKDAVGNETKVFIECVSGNLGDSVWPRVNNMPKKSGEGELFSITGLMILARNYLEVYIYDKWSDKELPLYEKGEIFRPCHVGIDQSATSPPQLLTEADLIQLMDKHGIGTDATHAEHIFKVKERNYVGNTGQGNKYLVPGKLGMGLVEGYDLMGFFLSRPHLRAKLESDLEDICRGQKQPSDVLQAHIREYKAIFIDAVIKINKLVEGVGKFLDHSPLSVDQSFVTVSSQDASQINVRACPNCAGFINIRRTQTSSYMLGCSNYPACKYTIWLPSIVEQAVIAKDHISSSPIACPNDHVNSKGHPVHKLSLEFNRRMNIIADIVPDEERRYVICIFCDKDACEILDIKHPSESINFIKPSPQQPVVKRPIKSNAISNPIPVVQHNIDRTVPIVSKLLNNSENFPLCLCGQPEVQRKVAKEGPNKGRMFYACAQQQCNAFNWADTPSLPSINMNSSEGHGDSNQIVTVNCECSIPAKLLTVTKESANKGRQFYSCSTRTCQFFQWFNEIKGGGKKSIAGKRCLPTEGNVDNKKRFTSTDNMWPPMANDFNSGNTKTRAPRLCSRCKNPGHTAKTCPQNK